MIKARNQGIKPRVNTGLALTFFRDKNWLNIFSTPLQHIYKTEGQKPHLNSQPDEYLSILFWSFIV